MSDKLIVTFSPAKVDVDITTPAVEVKTGLPVVKEYIDYPAYEGPDNEIVRPVNEVDA